MPARYEFDAELWQWDARTDSSWIFVSLPEDAADEIDDRFGGSAAGFGSLPVRVAIGGSVWTTSIFPSKQESTYVLPIKKAVRRAEEIELGDTATIELEIRADEP